MSVSSLILTRVLLPRIGQDTGMPNIQIVTDEATIKKYGGEKMYFAPPITYDEIMKTIPYGKVITVGVIREYLAKKNNADFQFVGLGTIYKYTLAGMDEDKLFREVP